jgi:hypothetical protein
MRAANVDREGKRLLDMIGRRGMVIHPRLLSICRASLRNVA